MYIVKISSTDLWRHQHPSEYTANSVWRKQYRINKLYLIFKGICIQLIQMQLAFDYIIALLCELQLAFVGIRTKWSATRLCWHQRPGGKLQLDFNGSSQLYKLQLTVGSLSTLLNELQWAFDGSSSRLMNDY